MTTVILFGLLFGCMFVGMPIAVALALSEEEEAALEMLSTAIGINEVNRVYARNDPDFSGLAANAEFRELTAPPADEDEEEEA